MLARSIAHEVSWFYNNLATGWRYPNVDLVMSGLSLVDTRRGLYALANRLPATPLPPMQVRTLPGIETALLLQWPSISSEVISVQTTADPVAGVWLDLASNVMATPPQNPYTGSINPANGYFRVRRN